jgi:hypothetical protein
MSSPSWIQALKDLIRETPTKAEYEKATAEMMDEKNDRKTVLIGATLIENILRHVIRNRLKPLSQTEEENLFGRDAPLSGFSHLIRIGHAFGMFDDAINRDLHRLREIRNTFAHSVRTIDFQTPAVRAAIAGFTTAQTPYYTDLPWPIDHPHAQFVTAIGRLARAFLPAPTLAPPLPTPMTYVLKD